MEHSIKYFPSLLPEKRAVTLVVHGLNLKPEAMLPLVNWLASHGSDVYQVSLSGHTKDGINITEVTASTWCTEMLQGYEMTKKASLYAEVPLYFLGYSLGALLAQSMVALSTENRAFDKQVLISPALTLRRRCCLIKLLFFLGKKRKVPSYTPESYRANDSLPLHVYKILFSEERKVLKAPSHQLNMPTLVLMDPKDELISYKRLLNYVNRRRLSNYLVFALNSSLRGRSERFHHLVIDEQTMGKENWKMATDKMASFLFGHSMQTKR